MDCRDALRRMLRLVEGMGGVDGDMEGRGQGSKRERMNKAYVLTFWEPRQQGTL